MSAASISSEHVNLLVYRYLLESGFTHSSFAFHQESNIKDAVKVKPGALLSLLHKSLLYIQVESHLDSTCSNSFDLISTHRCSLPTNKSTLRSLTGHLGEVYASAWNPVFPILATCSGDGTARIWNIPDSPDSPSSIAPIVLVHTREKDTRDVTTLEWNNNGERLATASYDGKARIWTRFGVCLFELTRHTGPIFAIRWNKSGDFLLSCSVDKSSIIWDTKTGQARQSFSFHSSGILDVDWRDNTTFASSSVDTSIFVCQLGSVEPILQFTGHSQEVNCIRFDSTGMLLASASDDHSVKIWSMETRNIIQNLDGHKKEVYSLEWCPVQVYNSTDQKPRRLLATASFDNDIRIWDVTSGTCVNTLSQHTASVYSVSWSPNGFHVASGSYDNTVNIWDIRNQGKLIKSIHSEGGVFQVNWSVDGDYLAICSAGGKVIVVYLKTMMSLLQ